MADPAVHIEALASGLEPADLEAVTQTVTAAGDAEARSATLPDALVCLVRGPAGAVVGASTAAEAVVELVGSQRFLLYGAALGPGAPATRDALLSQTFAALDAAFDAESDAAIGLCLVVADPAEMARRPEARWDDPPMLYAGYLDDGRQVRVAYFADARISHADG